MSDDEFGIDFITAANNKINGREKGKVVLPQQSVLTTNVNCAFSALLRKDVNQLCSVKSLQLAKAEERAKRKAMKSALGEINKCPKKKKKGSDKAKGKVKSEANGMKDVKNKKRRKVEVDADPCVLSDTDIEPEQPVESERCSSSYPSSHRACLTSL